MNAVVICGQTGNELWPLVRTKIPRETITIPGEDESLLSQTIRRLKPLVENPIIFVCSEEISEQISNCVASTGLLKKREYEILCEPFQRGTAFSIALTAAKLKRKDPNAYMLVTPSHLSMMADDRWEQAVTRGYRAASEDMIAVLGMSSRISSTPHCFIRPSREIKGIPGAHYVSRFAASPTPQQASRFVQIGLMWYTGVSIMRATTALAQMVYVARHSDSKASYDMDRVAETASFMTTLGDGKWHTDEAREIARSLPMVSFEKAVLEPSGTRSNSLAVISTSLDCSSMTSLKSIDDMVIPDSSENRIVGRGYAIESHNTTIYDDDRLAVLLGCDDLMVVNTRDAVLVASKDSLEMLDDVLPALVEAGAHEANDSSVAQHAWGKTTEVFKGESSVVKIVEILPGKEIAEYSRPNIEEHWTVLDGSAVFVSESIASSSSGKTEVSETRVGEGTAVLHAGQSVDFPAREKHSVRNQTKSTVSLTCVETLVKKRTRPAKPKTGSTEM